MDPSQVPSVAPPDGVTPNFVNPRSIGHIPRIGVYVFIPLMLVFLTLRIGTRVRLARALGLDDITCILAAACTVVFCGIVMPYFGYPQGVHQWDAPLSGITNQFLQASLISLMFSNLASMFIKTSLLVLYLHIFKPLLSARIAIWFGLVVVVIFYITCDAVVLGVCVFRSGPSRMKLMSENCFDAEMKTGLAAGWFGTLIDFYILAIPIRLISSLMLNKQRKIGVLAIFMTGLFACAASAANLAQRSKLSYTDMTYDGTLFYLYSIIEVNMAIISSGMPIITAPLKVMVTKIASSWDYLKKETQALRSSRGPTEDKTNNLIPNIPNAKISGLRTFIQNFQRSTHQDTSAAMDLSNFSKLDSFGEEYHQKIREIHKSSPASTLGTSAPGSRGQDVDGEV